MRSCKKKTLGTITNQKKVCQMAHFPFECPDYKAIKRNLFIFSISFYITGLTIHCGFLEHWNSQKSVSNIWQRFSCLLDEGIPNIWKKLNFHDSFLSYVQNSTANSAHLAAHFCPSLKKPLWESNLFQFLESPHQVDMKKVVKSSKHFFGYFTTLETQSDMLWPISVSDFIRIRAHFFSSNKPWGCMMRELCCCFRCFVYQVCN